MSKNDNRKILIVVHSIKGGCGKTTVSMALAQNFGLSMGSERVCYIDTDIVGVGASELAATEIIGQKRTITDYLLLNPFDDPLYFKTDIWDAKPGLFHKFICLDPGIREFNAIFSSVDKAAMERATRLSNDLFFAEEIKNKIKVLFAKLFDSSKEKNYHDILIVDTTPGFQGITSIVLELAEEIDKDKGIISPNGSKLFNVQVIHLIISTNNFTHLRSLEDYLAERLNKNEKFNYLVVLNQIPIGLELLHPPEEYIPKDELNNISESDPRITDFANMTEYKGNNQYRKKIFQAFKQYYTVKQKNFLSALFENSSIKNLDERVFIIPDLPSLRSIAAVFDIGKLDKGKFFSQLKDQADKGHISHVADHVIKTNYK
ncbi:MAG: P-loop NTPase [Desulfobacterales bacterium]|nr:P-loop NTPase [Desulfobacterales bacterium]